MLPELQEYLDNFYLNITGFWVMGSSDVQSSFFRDRPTGTVQTSKGSRLTIDVYNTIIKHIPEAPFSNNSYVNYLIERQARLTIIVSYEWLKNSQYWQSSLAQMPKEIHLYKYVRDAATHNNTFKFDDTRFLPLHWRGKELNETWAGSTLFYDWMAPGDIQLLFEDVSKALGY